MNSKMKRLLLLLLLLPICYSNAKNTGAGNFAGSLLLAENSVALYDVVQIGQPSLVEEQAMADLSDYFQRISGAHLSVQNQKGDKAAIFVGSCDREFLKDSFAHLQARDSFAIRTLRDSTGATNLYLVGHDSTATAFAVYTFLEDLGCRWFMPGEIGEVVPSKTKLLWEIKERTEQPDFPFRQIWWAYHGQEETAEAYRLWKLRNKVANPQIMHGHNLTNTLPPAKYWDSHPEYYALVNGKRRTSQICTTNPDAIRLVIEFINDYFDKYPQVMAYSLCPDDNIDFCECKNCRALDVGGIDKNYPDHPIVTDRYVHFLNEVARGIQVRHPGKKVSTYAYVNYSTPPIREKIDPNVVIVFTSSVYCGAHGIGDLQCLSRQEMKRDLVGWTQAASEVYIYDYDPTPYNAELPWPLFGARCREMSDYYAMGIKGFSFESHNSWATLAPNFYISAKTMWDAHADLSELMHDYLTKFFAESAGPMTEYYQALEEALRTTPDKIEWGQHSYPIIFTKETLARCRKAIDAAMAIASTEITRQRVQPVALGFEYLENYIHLREAASDKLEFAEYKKRRARCEDIINQLYGMNKDYILPEVALEYLRKGLGELATELYASDLGLVTHWMLIGPFDNVGNLGHDKVYPPEVEMDLAKTYVGANGEPIKWQEHKNPDWIGTIDFLQIFKQTGYVCAYAAAVVESPKKQKVQIRLGSNDSIKMWLNGKEVWNLNKGRVLGLDDDIVPVTLPAGKSKILLKICNRGANWGFCFRISDEKGNRIPGLKFSLPNN